MDDEDVKALKAEVFYNQIGYLSEELGDPERYYPSLKARGILDETDCETIRSKVTSREKVDTFVEIVHKRESSTGDPALDVFVDLLLSQVVQAHIARALLQALAQREPELKSRGRLSRSGSKSMTELSSSERCLGPEALMEAATVDCRESSTALTSLGIDGSLESAHMSNGRVALGGVPNGRRRAGMDLHHNTTTFNWKRTATDPHHSRPATRDDQQLGQQSLPTRQFHQSVHGRTRTHYLSRSFKAAASMLPQQSIEEEGGSENLGFECSVCMEKYEDEGPRAPRNLKCGHTYCTLCLQKMLPASQYEVPKINCPSCDDATAVPEKDVEKLSKNFGLLEVITGQGSYAPSSELHGQESPLTGQHPGDAGGVADMYCQEHGDHLSSFCVEDGVLVCSSCLVFGAHKHHNCLLVNKAANSYREKFRELAPEVSKQQKKLETALVRVQTAKERVQQSGQRLEAELEAEFGALQDLIEERRRCLKLEVMERTQTRVQALLDQESDLRENIEKASVAYHGSANLLRSDDISLLRGCGLALDQLEGVFIRPPPTATRANDDLVSQFSSDAQEDIASQVASYGRVYSEPGVVENVLLQPYHDGIRVTWDGHNYADNIGITYHLQMATNSSDFVNIFRGGDTKFTWKAKLELGMTYKFRVQVRTTEGVGNWSTPVETMRAAPAFRWHDNWRNVKIELSGGRLEASWSKGAVHNYWATFAGDKFYERRQHYVELEIVDLGKHPQKPTKRLAIGVVACCKEEASNVPWQDGKNAIGQWKEVPSWAFHPISGAINSMSLPAEGKPYSTIRLQNGDRIGMLVDMDQHQLTFFCNGQDLGVAFEGIEATSLLPAVSIKDKIRVRLSFPPPPYARRKPKLVRFSSGYHCTTRELRAL